MGYIIGLTGGVGCGKSTVVKLAKEHFCCRAILTDEVSRKQMEPGQAAYRAVVAEFGTGILAEDGTVDRAKLAAIVFSDGQKLRRLNALTHPLVTEYVLKEVERERASGGHEFLLIETALLIEGGYADFCDAVWYVYAPEQERRERLIQSRGYSQEKIEDIFAKQRTHEEFRAVATDVIRNGNEVSETELVEQLRAALERLRASYPHGDGR